MSSNTLTFFRFKALRGVMQLAMFKKQLGFQSELLEPKLMNGVKIEISRHFLLKNFIMRNRRSRHLFDITWHRWYFSNTNFESERRSQIEKKAGLFFKSER